MGFAFNPFTGNFDLKGSGGGGGASYIDGEVAVYADLPLDGTAPLNSAWLVRGNSGIWPFNKPAGIYYRSATAGVSRDADYTYGGTLGDVFADNVFLLYDNGDSTRNLQFDLSGITTGTTRTLTVPDASGRIQVEGQPIGNTTPAAGTFTTLTANNGTLTASAPVGNFSQTWNASGTTFTALRVNATETAAAAGSLLIDLQRGGTSQFIVRRDGVTAGSLFAIGTNTLGNTLYNGGVMMTSGSELAWANNASSVYNTLDVRLARDAAHTLALRRTTNAQTFNIYNTFTSDTNHERGFLKWSSNVFQIGTEKGSGGGTARNLEFQTDGATRFAIAANGNATIGGGLALGWGGGGTRIIGATFPSGLLQLQTGSTDRITIDANGIIGIGGTTASFPALKRNSTTLEVRLANDTAYTAIQGKLTTETAYTAGAPTATGYLVLYDSNGTAYKVPAEAL
jgi:hypothetical protein